MASIKFTQPGYTSAIKKYVYTDIHLDLMQDNIFAKNTGLIKSKNDIKIDYDIEAIKNSFRNLFNTSKGQRVLYPEYGSNLEKYLFERVTTDNAFNLGKDIQTAIEKYEPRATLLRVNVDINLERNGYNVTIIVYISNLGINTSISAYTTTAGFVII